MRGPASPKRAAQRPPTQLTTGEIEAGALRRRPNYWCRVDFADGGSQFVERDPQRAFALDVLDGFVRLVADNRLWMWRAAEVDYVHCAPEVRPEPILSADDPGDDL